MKSRLIKLQAEQAIKETEQFENQKYFRSRDIIEIFRISDLTLKNLRTSGQLPC